MPLLARRIVFNHKQGMRFPRQARRLDQIGSAVRCDSAQPSEVMVQVGDALKGGSSVLARVPVRQKLAPEPVHKER